MYQITRNRFPVADAWRISSSCSPFEAAGGTVKIGNKLYTHLHENSGAATELLDV